MRRGVDRSRHDLRRRTVSTTVARSTRRVERSLLSAKLLEIGFPAKQLTFEAGDVGDVGRLVEKAPQAVDTHLVVAMRLSRSIA